MLCLYVKDEASMSYNEVYKIHYYSEIDQDKGVGANLFGIEPCNLYAETEKCA